MHDEIRLFGASVSDVGVICFSWASSEEAAFFGVVLASWLERRQQRGLQVTEAYHVESGSWSLYSSILSSSASSTCSAPVSYRDIRQSRRSSQAKVVCVCATLTHLTALRVILIIVHGILGLALALLDRRLGGCVVDLGLGHVVVLDRAAHVCGL
jgi:hypothetical protein